MDFLFYFFDKKDLDIGTLVDEFMRVGVRVIKFKYVGDKMRVVGLFTDRDRIGQLFFLICPDLIKRKCDEEILISGVNCAYSLKL